MVCSSKSLLCQGSSGAEKERMGAQAAGREQRHTRRCIMHATRSSGGSAALGHR